MDLLRQLQSRIDRRSNFIFETEFKHANDGISGLFLSELRREQTLDKRLYGELLHKTKRIRQMGNMLYRLEKQLWETL